MSKMVLWRAAPAHPSIPMTVEVKEGVNEMCNLGEALVEETRIEWQAKGREEGREGTALNMLRRLVRRQVPINLQAVSDIAEDAEISVERVRELARDNGLVLS